MATSAPRTTTTPTPRVTVVGLGRHQRAGADRGRMEAAFGAAGGLGDLSGWPGPPGTGASRVSA